MQDRMMTASKPAILCSIDVMTYENITLPPPICGSGILILYRTKAFIIYLQGDTHIDKHIPDKYSQIGFTSTSLPSSPSASAAPIATAC